MHLPPSSGGNRISVVMCRWASLVPPDSTLAIALACNLNRTERGGGEEAATSGEFYHAKDVIVDVYRKNLIVRGGEICFME